MLRSANFVFRPLVSADAPEFVDAVLESVSTLSVWMPWAHDAYSITEALSWISYCQQAREVGAAHEFGIFDAATGALAGACGLNQFNRLHGFCNLGYWVRQSFQRRGAATEAVGVLSNYGFAELPLARIEIVVGVGNGASLGAALKSGAREEGVARNRLKLGARYLDAHILALLPPTSSRTT